MQTNFIFRSLRPSIFALASLFAALVACGGSSSSSPAPSDTPDASTQDDGATPPDVDAAAPPLDGATPQGDAADGTPTRHACTGSFGSGLSTDFGRLDGYLVSIVDPGQGKSCNGDSTHVHLQVLMKGSVYDVAVNIDGLEAEHDGPIPDFAWSEGWHPSGAGHVVALDYPSALGVHASDFTLTGNAQVAARVESQLANANHLAVFATGYGPDGAHLVHRQGSSNDGAIIIDPLAPVSHFLLFRFSNQSF